MASLTMLVLQDEAPGGRCEQAADTCMYSAGAPRARVASAALSTEAPRTAGPREGRLGHWGLCSRGRKGLEAARGRTGQH